MQTLEAAHPDARRLRRFRDLFRAEFAFVWSAAQHHGVPSGAVDDVVQDVFVTAYRRLDELRYEVSPRAWLFGVTRRVAFRYRRSAARMHRRHAAFAELARPTASTPQQRHDDADHLELLLGRLAPGTRVVWEMVELLGMTAPEIASELALPVNTVYSRLRLARQQLDELVSDPRRLAALCDASRSRRVPPRTASTRSWAIVLPALGKPGPGLAWLGWAKTHGAMATTLVTVSVAAIGLVIVRAPAPDMATSPSAIRPVRDVGPTHPPAAPVTPAAPPPDVGSSPPVLTDMSPRTFSKRQASERGDDGARARLAEEIALIDRAHAELRAGDLDAASATLADHARRFPTGSLVDVRAATQVDVLCGRGDATAAALTAQRLLRDYPGSAVAQRFSNFNFAARCGGDG